MNISPNMLWLYKTAVLTVLICTMAIESPFGRVQVAGADGGQAEPTADSTQDGQAAGTVQAKQTSAQLPIKKLSVFKKKLDESVPRWQALYGVPGVSIGLIQDGQFTETLHYGYSDKKNKMPIEDGTLFQVGSISESLTAWGVLRLAEQGLLSLDDPVETYLSRWQLPGSPFDHNEVTLGRLLSHMAGLPSHRGYPGTLFHRPMQSIEQSLSGEGSFNQKVEIADEPGTEAIHSGAGYTILQLVIEEVTGVPFEQYMAEQVLQPLGMSSSTFWQEPLDSRLSKSYGFFGQELPGYRFTESAAAGLQTTASDMMTFMLASMGSVTDNRPDLFTGELRDSAERGLLTEQFLVVEQDLFATELPDQRTLMYRSGDNRGWHAYYGFIPSEGDGIVILTNSDYGVDLRQDVYHAWVEYQTGQMPENYEYIVQKRKWNSALNLIVGASLGLYVLVAGIRISNGTRKFLFRHQEAGYFKFLIRSVCLIITGLLLVYASYVWSIINLHMGVNTLVLLALAWHAAFLATGFFPKKKRKAGPLLFQSKQLD
ncbi:MULTISPECIES: serine hydrolase domain-containing protein [unclassified Paenibacillus]|uniref:serine hydrolase domain-containing protein n=1 Tax=unclassified Paenibacillus TaxID=185978 RepID=UPI0036D36E3C